MGEQNKPRLDSKFFTMFILAFIVVLIGKIITGKLFSFTLRFLSSDIMWWSFIVSLQVIPQIALNSIILYVIMKLFKPGEKRTIIKAVAATIILEVAYSALMSLLLIAVSGTAQNALLFSLSIQWQLMGTLIEIALASLAIKLVYRTEKWSPLVAGFFWVAEMLLIGRTYRLIASFI